MCYVARNLLIICNIVHKHALQNFANYSLKVENKTIWFIIIMHEMKCMSSCFRM